jgi:hypothetical protein
MTLDSLRLCAGLAATNRMDEPREWKAWRLWKRITIPLVILDIAIIATILALERVSSIRNGIATIPNIPAAPSIRLSPSNVIWSYGLLWTALPSFLMTLYRIAWDALVNATADRQPFVELARDKDNASSARRTVMLDYRSYPALYNWAIAFRNQHFLLGISMLLSVVLSIALVPLTSHLLDTTPTEFLSVMTVSPARTFNDDIIDAGTDLQATMNVASAVSIFGATPLSWSTTQYAFEPFDIKDNSTSGNVTTRVPAYSGLLDCQVKTQSEFTATYSSHLSTVAIEGTDRGCDFQKKSITVSTNTLVYSLAYSNVHCGIAAHYSRFGIVTAGFSESSPNKLANLTVLSCIPSYWKTYGSLTVNVAPGKPVDITNFQPEENNATEIRPLFYTLVENTLASYTNYDPSTSIQSDLWGRLVYSLAARQNSDTPLDSNVIKASMETLFSSFFASMASSYAFSPSESAGEIDAVLTERVTRLFVISPIAWTVAVIILLVWICNVCLIIYTEKTHSILYEEPVGLLGSASLLQDSDVYDIVGKLRGNPPRTFSVRKEFEEMSDASRCWYDPDTKRILML